MKKAYVSENLKIYSFVYVPLDERMYVLLSDGEAAVVDPNMSKEAIELLKAEGIKKLTVIVTHSHYDHIMGINLLREHFDCTVLCTALAGEFLESPRKNLSRYANLVFAGHGMKSGEYEPIEPFSCRADVVFEKEYNFTLGSCKIHLTALAGHAPDSCVACVDGRLLFTGDELIPLTPTALTLPRSDAKAYERDVKSYFKALPENMYILPGHLDAGYLGDILKDHPDYI